MPDHDLAPVVLFVYNRPKHTKKTIESLLQNELANETILYVFADGPPSNAGSEDKKKIYDTRDLIKSITGFKEVRLLEKQTNEGLATSIINGVSEVIKKHHEVIVLEDDLVVAPTFLTYMNDGLRVYRHDYSVYSINGYMFPIKADVVDTFLCPLATSSWGWATWESKWAAFEPDIKYKGLIQSHPLIRQRFNFSDYDYANMLELKSSWAINWYYSVFIRNGLGLFPTRTLVQNIGFDGSGTHGENTLQSDSLYEGKIEVVKKHFIDLETYAKMLDFFNEEKNRTFKSIVNRIKSKFKASK